MYFVQTQTTKLLTKRNLWARPCEKTGPKNQWFKPLVSENKSVVRKKIISG